MNELSLFAAIIIPAYKEQEALPRLIEGIVSSELGPVHLVIVDDSPPEIATRTRFLCKSALLKSRFHFHFLTRGVKSGRGSAVRYGLDYALNLQPRLEYFLEMDADGSHQIEDVKKLLDSTLSNHVAIGSRYLHGSQILGWPTYRRYFSKVLNWLIPRLLNLKVVDITNGLRLYPRNAAEILATSKQETVGFIYLSEQLLTLKSAGFQIIELPTTFINRTLGKSSVSLRSLFQSLVEVWILVRKSRCL